MDKRQTQRRVGIFVGVGALLFFVVLFLLGREQSLFDSTTTLYVAFADVGGLKPGSQVRLAGMNIGTVSNIEFGRNLDDKKLHVELAIVSSMMPRVRKDSTATIATKGLLGDKVIEISIGSSRAARLKEGDYLQGQEPPDIFKILESGEGLIRDGSDLARSLKERVGAVASDKAVGDVHDIIASLNAILGEVEKGDGLAHGLVYDKQVKSDVKAMAANLRQASASLRDSMAHVENILREVRTGKGAIHALVYEEDGNKIVKNIRDVSQSLGELVAEIKNGQGLLHTLIYESDKGNLIRNLEEASSQVNGILAEIEKGHGTLGALIKDPTVFEDLKLVLGNLKRNAVLKSLIRMSLERSEADKRLTSEKARVEPEEEVPPPPPTSPAPANP